MKCRGLVVILGACLLLLAGVASSALAAAEEKLADARKLLSEAEPYIAKACDTDLDSDARKEARKEARRRLLPARDAYQAWQAANTKGDDEAFDQVGVRIVSQLHFINKMSSLSEVASGGGVTPPKSPTDGPPRPVTPEPPAPPPVPAPDATDPKSGGGAMPPIAPPAPPAPVDPAAKTKQDFQNLLEFERHNRSDLPAVKDAFEQFLADHPDSSAPEYTQVALRLGQLTAQLGGMFRDVAKRDLDSVLDTETKATPGIIARLKNELNTKDPDVRRRAATLLGLTRSPSAANVLVQALVDSDDEVARLATEGLVNIGGERMADILTKRYRDGRHEAQTTALSVLTKVAGKSDIDARLMSFSLGRFVLSNDQEVAGAALDFLAGLGTAGGVGLVEALDSRLPLKRLQVMDAIAKARYNPGASALVGFLVLGDGQTAIYRGRAIETIKSLGLPAFGYAMDGLRNGRTKQWTAYLLGEMSGQRFGSSDMKSWSEWWERNRPAESRAEEKK